MTDTTWTRPDTADGTCAACGAPSNDHLWIDLTRAELGEWAERAGRPAMARPADEWDVEFCSDTCADVYLPDVEL